MNWHFGMCRFESIVIRPRAVGTERSSFGRAVSTQMFRGRVLVAADEAVMYFEMKVREFLCRDCGRPFKSTSPNAVRCSECRKNWSVKRNREHQKRQCAALKRRRASSCAHTADAG